MLWQNQNIKNLCGEIVAKKKKKKKKRMRSAKGFHLIFFWFGKRTVVLK